MLYYLVKFMAITAIKTFFNKISAENVENISKDTPIVFAANHPNTMMDPIIIGYTCRKKLYFFAKSTLFNNPISGWFLKRMQLVPVYRKQDNPTLMHKNESTFTKGFEILSKGNAFLIFPEGISTGDRILSEIKTGAARIGLGAECENNWNLGVKIIPVGLNYSRAIKFRSDVSARFGKPILLSEYRRLYEEDETEAVYQVTNQIETALSKLTINLQDLEMQEIVEALETIYKQELAVDLGMEIKDKAEDFSITKGLINAVEWYFENDPDRVEKFKAMLSKYLRILKRLHIKDEFLDPTTESINLWERFKALSYLIVLFPLYLYGLINNVIPYKFPRWYTKHFVKYKSEIAPWKMVSGTAIFLVYYPIEIIIVAMLTGSFLWTLLYALSLVPSGNFVLKYLQRVRDYRQHLRFLSIFYRKRPLIYELIKQRQEIIDFLNNCKTEYMEAVNIPLPKHS
ncbi:MAG: lysophospholipid acyltransferase family protein [Candidatus Marinimicrobia bacterium]|nr:lysophospholipid acyltransferase family protein [Candidatus Neomarinimicrobiota bacterium]